MDKDLKNLLLKLHSLAGIANSEDRFREAVHKLCSEMAEEISNYRSNTNEISTRNYCDRTGENG